MLRAPSPVLQMFDSLKKEMEKAAKIRAALTRDRDEARRRAESTEASFANLKKQVYW